MSNDMFIDSYKRNNPLGFPLDSNIYLEKDYIDPITKNDLEKLKIIDEKAYEKYYRIIRNNVAKSNKLNLYNPVMITTNEYQEIDFPIQDINVDLEEYVDRYIFDDEKVYLYTKANEYIPNQVTTPSVYMSSYLTHGNMSFGIISEISKSEEFEVWGIISCGDFYITDRQIIIFEKGIQKGIRSFFYNTYLGSDGFKRNVISIPLSDIESIIGDEKDGLLKIYRKGGRRHSFNKSDSNRKKYRFSNDELRYMVNLLGSLINNETKETWATPEEKANEIIYNNEDKSKLKSNLNEHTYEKKANEIIYRNEDKTIKLHSNIKNEDTITAIRGKVTIYGSTQPNNSIFIRVWSSNEEPMFERSITTYNSGEFSYYLKSIGKNQVFYIEFYSNTTLDSEGNMKLVEESSPDITVIVKGSKSLF